MKLVKDSGPIHLGDNPSHHSPIFVKLDLGLLPVRVKSNPVRSKRPAWYKATEEQTAQYSEALGQKIDTLSMPNCLQCQDLKCKAAEHSGSRDGFVLDLLYFRNLPRHNPYGRRRPGQSQA